MCPYQDSALTYQHGSALESIDPHKFCSGNPEGLEQETEYCVHVAHCRWTRRDLIQSRTQTRGSRYRGMEWTRRKLQPPSGGESPPSPRHSWRTPLRSPRTPTPPVPPCTAFRWAACLYLGLINNRYKRKALEKCSPCFVPYIRTAQAPSLVPIPPGL